MAHRRFLWHHGITASLCRYCYFTNQKTKKITYLMRYSISKSFVTQSYAEDSAVARGSECDKVTNGLEMESQASLTNL